MSANSSHIDLNSDVVSSDVENEAPGVNTLEPSVRDVGSGSEPETLTVTEPLDSQGQVQGSSVGEAKNDKDWVLESKHSVGNVDDVVGDSVSIEKNVGAVDGVEGNLESHGGNDPMQNRTEEEVAERDGDQNGKQEAAQVARSDGDENGKQVRVEEVLGTDQLQDGGALSSRQGDREPCIESFSQSPNVAGINDSVGARVSEVLASEGLENQAMKMDAVVETDEKQSPGSRVVEGGVSQDIGDESNSFNLVVDLNPYMTMDENVSGDVNVKSGASRPVFRVPDLVWGKVRSHPWWPGQIFDPSDSSDKAKKYFRKDGYLIAYFGDQTFAWNEESRIKHFRAHFSQMEKQSTKEEFHYAVDCALEEVSRRVEFGLACSCISEEVYAKLRTQIISNAGIREESSRRDGGDNYLSADSLDPVDLVKYIKALAQSPCGEPDRLEFVIAWAQLSAFYRWKGYSQLPEFNMLGALLESDVDILPLGEKKNHSELNENAVPDIDDDKLVPSGKGKSKSQVSSSGKRKHISGDSTYPSKKEKKEKSLSDLLTEKGLCTSNGENRSKRKDVGKLLSQLSAKKRKAVDGMSDDSAVKNENCHPSTGVADNTVQTKKTFRVGDSIRRAASQLNGSSPILKNGDGVSQDTVVKNKSKQKTSLERSHISELTEMEVSSPGEMLSQLCLAARDPMKGYSFLVSIVSFFSEFRNSVRLDDPSFKEHEWPLKQAFGGKTRKKSTKPGFHEKSKLDVMNDSYWTDRIIQSLPEEHSSLLENLNEARENLPGTPSEKVSAAVEPQEGFDSFEMSLTIDSMRQKSGEKPESDAVKPVGHLEESFRPDPSPTALILNFKDVDAIPSEANLNKIFSRFGPLNEPESEVIRKSNRAKVVFKRRSDAETAFSSAGKFSIFGPSLVSYRLKYLSSSPSKASPGAKKRGRKDTTSVEGNVV